MDSFMNRSEAGNKGYEKTKDILQKLRDEKKAVKRGRIMRTTQNIVCSVGKKSPTRSEQVSFVIILAVQSLTIAG
jgi:hypothetical protein